MTHWRHYVAVSILLIVGACDSAANDGQQSKNSAGECAAQANTFTACTQACGATPMQDAPSCMLAAHRQCIATCNQQNYELLASCHGSQKDQALAACWQQDVACLQSASGGDEIACAGAAGGCEKSVLACYTGVNRGEAAIFPDCVSGQLCELALPTIDCPTTCELEGGCDKHVCEANCEHAREKSELNCYPATCLVSGEICYLACEEAFLDCRAQMTSCFDDEKACVDAANACVDACPVG